MPRAQSFYRLSKLAVDALPAWLLRVRPFHIFEIPLASYSSANGPHDPVADVETRWVESRQDLNVLASIADPRNLTKWDISTHRVAVALQDAAPIGLVWISTRLFEEPQLGLVVELEPEDVWLHSAYVVPSHRQKGVYRQLLKFVLHSLREQRFRRILLGVTSGNTASRRAHECFGAVDIGRIIAARSLGFTVCRTAGQVSCLTGRRTGLAHGVRVRLAPSIGAC